jgi:hypothetical protein
MDLALAPGQLSMTSISCYLENRGDGVGWRSTYCQ